MINLLCGWMQCFGIRGKSFNHKEVNVVSATWGSVVNERLFKLGYVIVVIVFFCQIDQFNVIRGIYLCFFNQDFVTSHSEKRNIISYFSNFITSSSK